MESSGLTPTIDNELRRLLTTMLSVEQIESLYLRTNLSFVTKNWIKSFLIERGRLKSDLVGLSIIKWIRFALSVIGALVMLGLLMLFIPKQLKLIALIPFYAAIRYAWRKLREIPKEELSLTSEPDQARINAPGLDEINQMKTKIGLDGFTKLMCAAQSWDIQTLNEELCLDTSNINQTCNKGYSTLAYAVNSDFCEGIKILLAHGAEVDLDANSEKKPAIRFIKSDEALKLLLTEAERRGNLR